MFLKNCARNRAQNTKGLLVDFLKNVIENFSHNNTSLYHIVKVKDWEFVLPDGSVQPKDSLILVQFFMVLVIAFELLSWVLIINSLKFEIVDGELVRI